MNEQSEVMTAELIDEKAEPRTVGYVKKSQKEFYFYTEDPVKFQGEEIDYFHFKKPSLKKAKNCGVVLSNELKAKDLEAMLRASLLRISKKDGGEFMSCNYREILENLDVDEATEMANHCSTFFVKVVD